MTNIVITPSKLSGKIDVPPSKSVAHRAIIAAALANGRSHIAPIAYSDDIVATINAMKRLGASLCAEGDALIIEGIDAPQKDAVTIDCNESGSTLRFILPIAVALGCEVTFEGQGNLPNRPLLPYLKLLDEQHIRYYLNSGKALPLRIAGQLQSGGFSLPGDVSSQFISGLLFALPLLKGDSCITLTSPLESSGYVDLTIGVLEQFGVYVTRTQDCNYQVAGNQSFVATSYHVEADFSQAAYFICLALMGADITVDGLDLHSLQGDREILSIIKRMGAQVIKTREGLRVICEELVATEINASEIPDIIPILAATACVAKGQTIIRNAGRLRLKECDRFAAIVEQLTLLGGDVYSIGDDIYINGKPSLHGGCETDSYQDHRIAMMLACIAQRCELPITIRGADCVRKSYPNFYEDLKSLGGIIQ